MQQIIVNQLPIMTMARMPRILIVDDEESVAFIFQKALRRLINCETITSSRAEEALQLFQQDPFDLLITDYQMPKMNGVALVREIRHLSSSVPIIIITAFDDEALYRQTDQLAIYRILRKPIDIVKLYRVVATALPETKQ